MPVTIPDSIYYADGTTPASIADITAAMAGSIQTALNYRGGRSFSWANDTERNAETGMLNGDVGYQADKELFYIYNSGWVIWAKAPDSYTPTITGITTVTSSSFTYSVDGGFVRVAGKITLGSTVTGAITISVPQDGLGNNLSINLTHLSALQSTQIGTGGANKSTTNYSALNVRVASATTVGLTALLYNPSASGSAQYVSHALTAAGVPFTWASGDTINVIFSYPVA